MVLIKMNFCLSNIASRIRLGTVFNEYRPVLRLALIGCLAVGLMGSNGLPSRADSDEDWPDRVDFPQQNVQQTTQNLPSPPHVESKKKKGLGYLLLHRNRPGDNQANAPPPDDDKPRDPAALPYPLLRLPVAVQTGDGILLAGIYMAKVEQGTALNAKDPANSQNDTTGAGKTTASEVSAPWIITLMQRNQPLIRFTLQSAPDANAENQTKNGTNSPLSKADPRLPPLLRADAVFSEDMQSITFRLRQDAQSFVSKAFPIAVDRRTILKY